MNNQHHDMILEAITGYVRRHSRLPVEAEPELWPLDHLDSVDMLDFIAFIESTFGIRVDDVDVRPENFETVGAVAQYVVGRTNTTSVPSPGDRG